MKYIFPLALFIIFISHYPILSLSFMDYNTNLSPDSTSPKNHLIPIPADSQFNRKRKAKPASNRKNNE